MIIREPRKLPDVPVKRLSESKSSENVSDKPPLQLLGGMTSSEYSLPVGIIASHVKQNNKENVQTSTPQLLSQSASGPGQLSHYNNKENVQTSTPRPLSQSASGPGQLSHYNRVSLKKTRGSYIKAVSSSQKIYGQDNKASNIALQIKGGTIEQALSDRNEVSYGYNAVCNYYNFFS